MFKFKIYKNNKLLVDSIKKYGEEGIYEMDDIAWDAANDELCDIAGEPVDVWNSEYRIDVEELSEAQMRKYCK